MNACSYMTFCWLVDQLLEILSFIVPVIFALTLLVYIWRVINALILKGGEQRAREEGKRIALEGILALVVMAAIWGLVARLSSSIFGA